MNERLVDMMLVVEDAAMLRNARRQSPDADPDLTTEDDVILAMLLQDRETFEVLHYKNLWTKALRIMLKSFVDSQG